MYNMCVCRFFFLNSESNEERISFTKLDSSFFVSVPKTSTTRSVPISTVTASFRYQIASN